MFFREFIICSLLFFTGLFNFTGNDNKVDKNVKTIEYTVVHRLEALNDLEDSYAEIDSNTFKVKKGTEVTPMVNTYENYVSPEVKTVKINKKGIEVIYDYELKEYNVHFHYNIKGLNDPTVKVEHGDVVEALASKEKVGYTFEFWRSMYGTEAFDFSQKVTKSFNLYAVYSANIDTKYTVTHRKENLDGTFTVAETENLTGTTDTLVTPVVNKYRGFDSPEAVEVKIAADGSLEVVYDYMLETHNVHFHYGIKKVYDPTVKVKHGDVVEALASKEKVGYTFEFWKSMYGTEAFDFSQKVIKSFNLYAVYSANTDTKYTVTHRKENLDGTFTVAETENLTGTTDTLVTPEVNSYKGYVSPEAVEVKIEADGSLNVVYDYTRKNCTIVYNHRGQKNIVKFKFGEPTPAPTREDFKEIEKWYVQGKDELFNFDIIRDGQDNVYSHL